jgi:hypothetical protein
MFRNSLNHYYLILCWISVSSNYDLFVVLFVISFSILIAQYCLGGVYICAPAHNMYKLLAGLYFCDMVKGGTLLDIKISAKSTNGIKMHFCDNDGNQTILVVLVSWLVSPQLLDVTTKIDPSR